MIILKKGDLPLHIAEAGKAFSEITSKYSGMQRGIEHLSASSIYDLAECSHKLSLRKQYRFYSIYAKLGQIFHGVLEQYGARKLYFMQNKIDAPVFTRESFEKMKYAVTKNLVNDTRTAVLTGTELLPTVADKIKDQIGDMDLFEKIAFHLAGFITMDLAEKAAIDGKFPIMQEAELRGILGKNLPFLGFSDSIKVSTDLKTVYIDDYKTAWTSASVDTWKKIKVPTLQFWIYEKLVLENIKYFVPSIEKVVTRLVLITIDKADIKKALNKANKKTTLKDVLVSKPVITLYTKEFESSPIVDAQYGAELDMARVMLDNNIAPVAKSKYGCGSCDYNTRCPYYTAVIEPPVETEEEVDEPE